MNVYEKIRDPKTGRYISIYGKLGQSILANYIKVYQLGGTGKDSTVERRIGWDGIDYTFVEFLSYYNNSIEKALEEWDRSSPLN